MKLRAVAVIAVALLVCRAHAGPLPQPLTLEAALSLADQPHPDLQLQMAGLDLARAEHQQAQAELGFEARFIADGRWVEPSTEAGSGVGGDSRFDSHNDSRFHLTLTKPLYNFGQSAARIAAAEASQDAERLRLESLKNRRRLQIMRSFFQVLLADLAFAEADEAMAVEFVRLDRMRDRSELGQVSDVQLAEQEHRYQRRRVARYQAEARQRTSRTHLAEVLNRPGDLPADLIVPPLDFVEREPPELTTWIEQALADSPRLQVLRAETEAAGEEMKAARYASRPTLTGELTASEYAREFTTREKYRAGLVLDAPLYTGGRVDAGRAQARARMQQVEARRAQARSEIREALRAAWERIAVLRIEREQAIAEMAYRDLDLDRARALYEMEASADLGNAMSDFSAARLRRAGAEYQLALTWAEVALLTGHPEWDPFAQ
jgi:outer membrane protein TolC